MQMLATGDDWTNGNETIRAVGMQTSIETLATRVLATEPRDNDLKLLIAQCLAKNPNHLPSLDVVLTTCQKAVRDRTETFYQKYFNKKALADHESDDSIRSYLQRQILDPPPSHDEDEVDWE